MSEYQRFRTGFRGFSKDDVLAYIDSMRAEFCEEREQYEGEIAALRRQLEESASKLAYLEEAQAREAALRAEIESAEQKVQTLAAENTALQEKLAAAERKIAENHEAEMAEALSQSAEEMRMLRERETALNAQLAEAHQAIATLWQEKETLERKAASAADFADALQLRTAEFKQQLGSAVLTEENGGESGKPMERWLF